MMNDEKASKVSVTDLDMPFLSMVRFMVKWAIASVPALFILIVISAAIWSGVTGMLGASSRVTTLDDPVTALDAPVQSGSPLGPATAGSLSGDSWRLIESQNPLDDSPTVILSLDAATGRSRFGRAPTLVLRCKSNTTDAYIEWNEYLGSDEAEVTTRIGRSAAQTRPWSLSTDNTGTFYPGSAIAFAKALMSVDTLVTSITPYNESPITAVFEVNGLRTRITPLSRACHWG